MAYLVSIEESVKRILETPLGSRVMLPDFGSKLHTLIDKRVDEKYKLLFISYVFEAVKRWEKRIKLRRALPIVDAVSGVIKISLEFEDENNKIKTTEISYVATKRN